MTILGLDIGGANIKAADDTGRAVSRPFAIWNHRDRLKDEIASILREFPNTDRVALTMTAELADCFSTKSEGVRFILETVDECVCREFPVRKNNFASSHFPQREGGAADGEHVAIENAAHAASRDANAPSVVIWSTDGRFVPASEARDCHLKVAGANWHALATWCGQFFTTGASLLVDIGTTTTDMIPLFDGKPVPIGSTDVARLQSGELSYSGIRRTPICAIAHSVPFRDGYCSIAAEVFSTTLDVHLMLGSIPEDSQNFDTANGKPATKTAAHDRIARMICCDRDEVSYDEAVQIARFLADVQRQRLAGSLERVAHRFPAVCQNVIISGSGSFLGLQIVYENRHTTNAKVISLAKKFSPSVAEAACAFAVAQLVAMT